MDKPNCINFSSGPCAKPSTWTTPAGKLLGRSHRSSECMCEINETVQLLKSLLNIPNDYFIGILSASTSGAMETLLWSLLGAIPVTVLAQCVFSNHWANDVVDQLKLPNTNIISAEFPHIADVTKVDFNSDVVFCMTSTTSGVSFQNTNWIDDNRKGLTICDAASAVFCMHLDWQKLDATAFSWQKGIGGEAGLGTIVLSPRAIQRLETYEPQWPIPRVFRIAQKKKVNFAVFNGNTINTPSMMCIEDFHNNLTWAQKQGGLALLCSKIKANYDVVAKWISNNTTFEFLVDESCRARHIICLDIKNEKYQSLSEEAKWVFLKQIVLICEEEQVGVDFLGHMLVKPNLRIWIGPTIENDDLQKFLPWLTYAYEKVICK